MDFDVLKEKLLNLYQLERDDASKRGHQMRAILVELNAEEFNSAETQSDLLHKLVHDCAKTLPFIEQVDAFGKGLQGLFSQQALKEAGIYLDQQPEGIVQPEQEYLFINTSAERRACALNVDSQVAFLGRWSVEARQAFVTAFANTHVTLRDDKANAHKLGANTSVIRLPACYYQPVVCDSMGREAESVLASEGGEAALRYLTEHVGEPEAMNLQQLQDAVTLVRGDEVEATNDRYTLVLEGDQGLKLYQRFSEQEVAQVLSQRNKLSGLSMAVWELNTALKRDAFLKQPGERLVIGQNYRGEDVTLEINVPLHCYHCHHMYVQEKGEWTRFGCPIEMNPHASLNEDIELIKCQLGDNLRQQPEREQKSGLKR